MGKNLLLQGTLSNGIETFQSLYHDTNRWWITWLGIAIRKQLDIRYLFGVEYPIE